MELAASLLQHTVLSAGINAPHVGDGLKHFECANLAGCSGKWWEAVKSFQKGLRLLLGALQDVSEGRRVSRGSVTLNRD